MGGIIYERLFVFLYFCFRYITEKEYVMARPVKETPILFGDEAKRFEMQMMNPKRLTSERKKRIKKDYEFLRSKCVNCSF